MIKILIILFTTLYSHQALAISKVPTHNCHYGDCYDDIAEGYVTHTKNYQVGICLNKEGTWMIITSSKNNDFTRLKSIPTKKGVYEASDNNGKLYFLDENNKIFRIIQNKKVIVEEKFKEEIDS